MSLFVLSFKGDAATLLQEEIAREKQVLDVHMNILHQQGGCRRGEHSRQSLPGFVSQDFNGQIHLVAPQLLKGNVTDSKC